MNTTSKPKPYVPSAFDPADFAQIEPLCRELIGRSLNLPDDLQRWMTDCSELFEFIYEHGSRKNIDNACHTDDPAKEKAYRHWLTEIQPKLKPLVFELQKKYLACPAHVDVPEPGFKILTREWKTDVELFRDENVPLQTREDELATDYGKIMGAMTVEFRGKKQTLQQLARYLEETDRTTRQEAWELSVQRRLEDRERIDALFDELIRLRRQIARNAGTGDYRAYMWLAKKRFDYTPQDCLAFGDSVQKTCVPLGEKLDLQRKETLGLPGLRPWDTAVDPKGRPPLRPFPAEDTDAFVRGVREIFNRVSPELARQFASLQEHGDLDLASRPAKRPGGFQAALEASKRPFIFMNAAGLQHDVDTLLHEGGHAFHYLASRAIPIVFFRHAPLEFCEVASMSMELLGCDHYDIFYRNPEESARAKRLQLEGVIRILPWVATVDGFQHWLYTHPEHRPNERTEAWMELLRRFSSPVVDWSGYELARETAWHRQLHLFEVPFYYIEYGIAQLGALQVWLNYRRDPRRTLEQLLQAFALGGSRPLPDLFTAAGIRFDFSPATLQLLMDSVARELAALPV